MGDDLAKTISGLSEFIAGGGGELLASLFSVPSVESKDSAKEGNPTVDSEVTILGEGSAQTPKTAVADIHGSNVAPTQNEPDISTLKLLETFSIISDCGGANFKLLSALKPYLSGNRQKKYDTAVRIMQLSRLPQIQGLFARKEG